MRVMMMMRMRVRRLFKKKETDRNVFLCIRRVGPIVLTCEASSMMF